MKIMTSIFAQRRILSGLEYAVDVVLVGEDSSKLQDFLGRLKDRVCLECVLHLRSWRTGLAQSRTLCFPGNNWVRLTDSIKG